MPGRPVPSTVDLTRLGTELKLRLAAQSALQLEERFHDNGRLHVDQVLLKTRSHHNIVNENNGILEFFAISEELWPQISLSSVHTSRECESENLSLMFTDTRCE